MTGRELGKELGSALKDTGRILANTTRERHTFTGKVGFLRFRCDCSKLHLPMRPPFICETLLRVKVGVLSSVQPMVMRICSVVKEASGEEAR